MKRWKKKKRMKRWKKCGRYRNEIVQEKIEQESETDETLTNCREWYTMNKSSLCYCIHTLQYVKRHCVAGYLLVIIILLAPCNTVALDVLQNKNSVDPDGLLSYHSLPLVKGAVPYETALLLCCCSWNRHQQTALLNQVSRKDWPRTEKQRYKPYGYSAKFQRRP